MDWIRELFALFDGLVFSGPVGLAKPDRAIFEHLLNHHGLDAQECVFINDTSRNIIACEAVGIHGILFDGDAVSLRRTLEL